MYVTFPIVTANPGKNSICTSTVQCTCTCTLYSRCTYKELSSGVVACICLVSITDYSCTCTLYIVHVHVYADDRFETRTVLKPSNGFKSVWTVLKPSGPINIALNYPDRFETSALRLSTTPMACSRLPHWSRHIM